MFFLVCRLLENAALRSNLLLSLTGLRPFFSQAEATTGSIQWFDEDWEVISKDARDFVVKLLTVDPKERLSAEAALAHPWFSIELPASASS